LFWGWSERAGVPRRGPGFPPPGCQYSRPVWVRFCFFLVKILLGSGLGDIITSLVGFPFLLGCRFCSRHGGGKNEMNTQVSVSVRPGGVGWRRAVAIFLSADVFLDVRSVSFWVFSLWGSPLYPQNTPNKQQQKQAGMQTGWRLQGGWGQLFSEFFYNFIFKAFFWFRFGFYPSGVPRVHPATPS
jgi:hypothetical protein